MKISFRGWLLIGTLAALIAVLAIYGAPLLSAADAASKSSAALTNESLGNMLSAMGLVPKKQEQRYDFTFKALYGGEEWDLTMSTVLSQNGDWIWIMAWLDELPRSAADVPRTALLRLLADNDSMGTGKFFAYVSGNRRFVLQRVVRNENISSAAFQEILKDLGASVVETYPHWNVEAWKENTRSRTTQSNPQSSAAQKQSASTGRFPSRGAAIHSAGSVR